MDKLNLAKDLEKNAPYKDVNHGQYKIYKNAYNRISKNLKNNKYHDIPNYSQKSLELWSYEKDLSKSYSQQLNQVLWSFLLFDERSKAKLKILDQAIKIYIETIHTFCTMEKSKYVLAYLKHKGYATYLDFMQDFSDLHGIDVDEYRISKINSFRISGNESSESKIYNKINIQDMAISILKKSQKSILGDSIMINNIEPDDTIRADEAYNKELRRLIYNSVSFPIYVQNYDLPLLKMLESNKVGFEFNMLDTREDIHVQLDEVLDQEKLPERPVLLSAKQELLNTYLPEDNKVRKLESIIASQKAFTIYQYLQHCRSQEQARQLFNFHILFANFEKNGFDDEFIYTDRDYIYIERNYLIPSTSLKEIRKQISIITSMLNLKNSQ